MCNPITQASLGIAIRQRLFDEAKRTTPRGRRGRRRNTGSLLLRLSLARGYERWCTSRLTRRRLGGDANALKAISLKPTTRGRTAARVRNMVTGELIDETRLLKRARQLAPARSGSASTSRNFISANRTSTPRASWSNRWRRTRPTRRSRRTRNRSLNQS